MLDLIRGRDFADYFDLAVHDKGGCHHYAEFHHLVNVRYFFHLEFEFEFLRGGLCVFGQFLAFGITRAENLYFFYRIFLAD